MDQAGPEFEQDELGELVASIDRTPIATVVTDNRLPDNPIVAVNEAFVALTGYPRDEAIGRNCRFLAGPATEPEASAALREAIAAGRAAVVELTNYRKDGTAFRNAVMVAPISGRTGQAELFIGSQMDVGASAHSGLRLARARRLLSALSPRQRQVLQLMTAGYRNKQIAGLLGIDEKTVKMHRARAIEALGASGTAEAIRIAVEADLALDDPR